MKDKLADVISRINKLLRVASSSDKPGEVASAQAIAQELITKYQIEEAQLHEHIGVGDITSKIVYMPKPYVIDKSMLLNSIAKHNFCKVLRGNDYCIIYGYDSDITLCVALYETLSLHMISEMHSKLDQAKSEDTVKDTRSWIKSFFGGYTLMIAERIEASKTRTINDLQSKSTSVAIAVKDKQHAIEEFFQGISYHRSSDRKISSEPGYAAGTISAKNAVINQTTLEE